MALIRTLLILTFDENDTFNEKAMIRNVFEERGFKLIAETKIEKTNIVKEWIMQSPTQLGKLNADAFPEQKKIYQFNPAGEK